MARHLLPLLLLLWANVHTAQKPVRIIIHHKLGGAPFAMNQPAENNTGDDFIVTRLQYFLSEFTLTHDGGQILRLEDTFALVNAAEATSIDLGVLPVHSVERLDFGIGVPSPENNADPTLWPAGHPLAPGTPSMHWGWAGGYRFIAMEGEAGPSFKTNYQFHPLGNENYQFARILVSATEVQDTLLLELDADYAEALYDIDVESGPISHGNLWLAPVILGNFRNRVFTPTNSPTAVYEQGETPGLRIFPNPADGLVNVRLDIQKTGIIRVDVFDAGGRFLFRENSMPRHAFSIPLPHAGLFVLRLSDELGNSSLVRLVSQ